MTLAGVPVESLHFADMIHGLLTTGGIIPAAGAATGRIADAFFGDSIANRRCQSFSR